MGWAQNPLHSIPVLPKTTCGVNFSAIDLIILFALILDFDSEISFYFFVNLAQNPLHSTPVVSKPTWCKLVCHKSDFSVSFDIWFRFRLKFLFYFLWTEHRTSCIAYRYCQTPRGVNLGALISNALVVLHMLQVVDLSPLLWQHVNYLQHRITNVDNALT